MSIPKFKHKLANANFKLAKSKFKAAFTKTCRNEFFGIFFKFVKLVMNIYEFLNGMPRILNL